MVLVKYWTSAGTNIFPTMVSQVLPDSDKELIKGKFLVALFRVGDNFLGIAGMEVARETGSDRVNSK